MLIDTDNKKSHEKIVKSVTVKKIVVLFTRVSKTQHCLVGWRRYQRKVQVPVGKFGNSFLPRVVIFVIRTVEVIVALSSLFVGPSHTQVSGKKNLLLLYEEAELYNMSHA